MKDEIEKLNTMTEKLRADATKHDEKKEFMDEIAKLKSSTQSFTTSHETRSKIGEPSLQEQRCEGRWKRCRMNW
jgi:hypothetical protein